jgi:hypothetical protein
MGITAGGYPASTGFEINMVGARYLEFIGITCAPKLFSDC